MPVCVYRLHHAQSHPEMEIWNGSDATDLVACRPLGLLASAPIMLPGNSIVPENQVPIYDATRESLLGWKRSC